MHVSQGSQMYTLKLFFYLSHFASTTEGSLLGSNFSIQENVHAHLSPRLAAARPASSSLHTLSEKFCQFHQVSRSSPVCSVSVLCHSVHIHSSNAHTLAQHCMQAYSTPRWQLQWEAYEDTVCTKHGRSKLPFSVSLRISTVSLIKLLLYLYYMTYRLLQKPGSSSSSSNSSSSPFLPIDSARDAYQL